MRNDFESNYLEHSAKGTSWRKKGAKYLSRVWKNGRWVYEYKITGKGYLKDAKSFRKRGRRAANVGEKAYDNNDKARFKAATKQLDYYIGKEDDAYNDYYNKSVSGRIEEAVASGRATIEDLFDSLKTKETVYVTDTFTGEKRTPSTSGNTVNIKELSKKNKKKK